MTAFRKLLPIAALALLATAGLAAAGEMEKGIAAQAAFDTLKSLEGTWVGTATGSEEGDLGETTHEFEVSAGGTVVMETMAPGTEYEMINMYHLDGAELVLTHYCAGGNQPTMRLDRAHASAGELPFVFTGGTNLDPATDHHIHDARLILRDDGGLDSHWSSFAEGEEAGEMVFALRRSGG